MADVSPEEADGALLDLLAAQGYAGPHYQMFENSLTRYGLAKMEGWVRSGYIFVLVKRHGRPVNPRPSERAELARDGDARQGLVTATVTRAMLRFRRDALIKRSWRPTGGASLTTYFGVTCQQEFPGEFDRFRRARRRWTRALATEMSIVGAGDVTTLDPETLVLGQLWVAQELARLTPRTRAAVILLCDGYAHDEIAEILGTTARAVEGMLYRWRKSAVAEIVAQRSGERDG